MTTQIVHGTPSVFVTSGDSGAHTTAHVALQGAHVAPVTFADGGRSASPYAVAPWMPGEIPGLPPILDTLRGDFFCLPFGEQDGWETHGTPPSAGWDVSIQSDDSVTLHLEAPDTGASIDRTVSVRAGETVLYQEAVVSGLDGQFPYGMHPIIDLSGYPDGAARVSTSALALGAVFPGAFANPEIGETQILAPGAKFSDLARVPTAAGGVLDLTHYPTAERHEDLVMLVNDTAGGPLGWSAIATPDYVWIALKDVRVLPSTILWCSNGGRTQPPWSGRFRGRIGVEDVCAYFSTGTDRSRSNDLQARGVKTVGTFTSAAAVHVRTAHVVAFPTTSFGRVADVEAVQPGQVLIRDDEGRELTARVDWQWVLG